MTSDLPELRATHADRDRAVETLRIAGGDGRLTAEELDERLGVALSARTVGELAALTVDLTVRRSSVLAAKDVLEVRQQGSWYVAGTGRWVVPRRIDLRTRLCRVTLDFAEAVITPGTLRIDLDMVHGKLARSSARPASRSTPTGCTLTYSRCKLRPVRAGADPRLRIELLGDAPARQGHRALAAARRRRLLTESRSLDSDRELSYLRLNVNIDVNTRSVAEERPCDSSSFTVQVTVPGAGTCWSPN